MQTPLLTLQSNGTVIKKMAPFEMPTRKKLDESPEQIGETVTLGALLGPSEEGRGRPQEATGRRRDDVQLPQAAEPRSTPPKTLLMQMEEIHSEYPDIQLDYQAAERGLGWGHQYNEVKASEEAFSNMIDHMGQWLMKH